MARATRLVAVLGLLGATTVLTAAPAHADVVDPPGLCSASGTWQQQGAERVSTDFKPSDVIEIPQKDTVLWAGAVGDAEPGGEGPRRDISGEVTVKVAGLYDAEIDNWGSSSVRYANEGEYKYDVPSFLLNIKMKLSGEHRESGEKVCSGSVYLKVKGGTFGNPLAIAGLILVLLSGLGLLKGGSVLRALSGFVFGLALGLVLLTMGVLPLDSILLAVLPILFLIVGIAVAALKRGGSPSPAAS